MAPVIADTGTSPQIVCLHAVQIVADGQATRGVIVKLSTEGGVLRCRLDVRQGDLVVVAGYFDNNPVKAAIAVSERLDGGFAFRFAAMAADSRAHLARFVFSRFKRREIPPASAKAPLAVRSVTIVPSVRKPAEPYTARNKEVSRHQEIHRRWLDKQFGSPDEVIAPRS